MSKEVQDDLSERLKSREHVEQLITQGKLEQTMKIIEGRKNEEGVEEIRWGILESKCRASMGEFEQVIEITKKITKEIEKIEEPVEKGEKERIRIDVLNEHIWALGRLGRQKEGLEKAEEGIRLIEELEELEEVEGREEKDKKRKADLLLTKGNFYLAKGEPDQSLEYYEKGLAMSIEPINKRPIATILFIIGSIYIWRRDLDQALEYYEKSLVIREEIKNKQEIARSLSNIGLTYQMKGELDKAVKNFDRSQAICEKGGYKQVVGYPLCNMGIVFQIRGELDQALEYYKKSLTIFKELGAKHHIVELLLFIGSLYQELGKLEKALDFFKQTLPICEEIGSKTIMSYPLFYLISVTLDLEDIKQARRYLKELQQINKQEEIKYVDLFSKLAEALVLKKSKRRKHLTKAEEILEEIIEEAEEEITEHQFYVQALVNLSEILLEELQSTGEEDILEEVEEKANKLVKIAKEQQSYALLTETYLLKAQLALVRLNLLDARNLLTQAQVIAEEKGLERLARKISREHDKLLEQLDQWKELIAKDAAITERVKVANLEELVGWMARKREIKIEEKEDEPVMLLLVAECGLPIYSKQFDQTRELHDMLISGFLSSINAFVQEVFHSPGMIRRIMHDEYTLSFELIDPILFCYVYEGQSYTAMKKLEKLITKVHESEVWSALEEVGKKGYMLNKSDIAQMEGVIGEIFRTN